MNNSVNEHNEIIQFADDTLFRNTNEDIKKAVLNLQDNVPKILKYHEDRGLETNAENPQLIIFTKK